jgi:hypothetical protein
MFFSPYKLFFMTINQLLTNVLGGGVLGLLGQGVRIAIGLKKLNDDNKMKAVQNVPTEPFNAGRLVVSLFIGFVAGAFGMLTKNPAAGTGGDLSTESIVTIIAIGYSGADFIEGLFNTYVQKFTPPAAPAIVATGGQAVVAAAIGNQAVVAAAADPAPTERVPAVVMPAVIVPDQPVVAAVATNRGSAAVATGNVIRPDRPLVITAAASSSTNDTSNSAEHDR